MTLEWPWSVLRQGQILLFRLFYGKTVDFSETIAACDLKVGRCRQLIEIMKVCEYWKSRSILYHIFSRFFLFTSALLGQDIRWAFTGPLVLWLIGSFSFWPVMRTTIKAWMSSNLGRIPPLTLELAALEHLKKTTYNLVSTLARIFFILGGMEDNHYILDEFKIRQDSTTDCGVSCPWAFEKISIGL